MAVTIQRVADKKAEQASGYTADFERLFQENWSRVNKVLYGLLGDSDEAQDLALETFWRLYSRPPKDRENLAGWLHRVALRLGYNALRSNKRRDCYELEAGKFFLNSNVNDPSKEVELSEQRRRVRFALARMKPRSAEILILRHSGFSYAEIGAAIGAPATSVGTLLARAEKEFEKRFLKERD